MNPHRGEMCKTGEYYHYKVVRAEELRKNYGGCANTAKASLEAFAPGQSINPTYSK
jgi:hypothetical protein